MEAPPHQLSNVSQTGPFPGAGEGVSHGADRSTKPKKALPFFSVRSPTPCIRLSLVRTTLPLRWLGRSIPVFTSVLSKRGFK